MLQHVVMWKMKEEALGMKRPTLALEMKQRLLALVGQIPEIRSFQVGINELPSETAHDVVLVSSFDDMNGLQGYMKNPIHQTVVAFAGEAVAERRAVDYQS
jgi:hypothetical protein